MYIIEACPCCLSTESTKRCAVVAPFLAHYAVEQPPFLCNLLECSACTFRFFDARLDSAEVARLYSGYRGDRYFAERHRWEFWYSRKVNDGIGGDPEEIAVRVAAMERLVLPHIESSTVTSVLDYGGDRGQFIPKSLGTQKFVYELSDAVPEPGVNRIASEKELLTKKFDLIMALGVLEHCSEPADVLKQLRSCLNPGAFLCVGVPHERYGIAFAGKGSLYRSYLKLLLSFAPALVAVDFYSAASRIRLGMIPPFGLLKCHEHLNYFNHKSMAALLERLGFEVVDSKIENIAKYPARNESLYMLARLR
ncbi:MAG TPA: methyltransferase domain-containing protein [Acidobacteriaceae bacterium]